MLDADNLCFLLKCWEYLVNLLVQLLSRFNSDGKLDEESVWRKNDLTVHLARSSSAHKFALRSMLNRLNGGRNRLPETGKSERSTLLAHEIEPWHKRIRDPSSDIVLQWNRVFFGACLVALFVDPFYFYLLSVGGDDNCVRTDSQLQIVVTFFRTVADLFYLLHMVIQFRTGYIAPSTRVFGRGELVTDPKKIARRYLRSKFFIDLVASLPLPQVSYFDISTLTFWF